MSDLAEAPRLSDNEAGEPGVAILERLARAVQNETLPCTLRMQRDWNRHLYLRNGRTLQSSSTATSGYAARYAMGRISGFAASALGDHVELPTVLHQARDRIDCLQRYWPHPSTPVTGQSVGEGIYDFRCGGKGYSATERVERLRHLSSVIAGRCPGSATIILGLEEVAVERAVATSGGARFYGYAPRTTLVVQVDLVRDGCRGQASENYTLFGEVEQRLDRLIDQVLGEIDELYAHAQKDLEAVHPEPGMHDVVMTSGLTGLLAHEAIGHPCEADHVTMGSAMADALGQRVSSEKITLVDQAGCGFDGGATTAAFFDDEGVEAQDAVLIERGHLVGFLHNRFTAGLMDAVPAGNARSGTFAGEPLIRMRNTAILPGSDTLGDMIGAIDKGYLLERPGHGRADLTGQFTFGVTRGYEIRNGRIGRAIRNMTVSGNGFDVLRSVSHVGADFAWMPSGWCAKGQSIPVAMGGPSIKARLTIGGR